MKNVAVFTLIFSVFAVAILGVFAMDHGSHSHNSCLAAIARNTSCPEPSSISDFIAFHLGSLKRFSEGVAAIMGIDALFALVALSSVFAAIFLETNNPKYFSDSAESLSHAIATPSVVHRLVAWHSLLENSPNLI